MLLSWLALLPTSSGQVKRPTGKAKLGAARTAKAAPKNLVTPPASVAEPEEPFVRRERVRGLIAVDDVDKQSTRAAVIVGVSRYKYRDNDTTRTEKKIGKNPNPPTGWQDITGAYDAADFLKFLRKPIGGGYEENEYTFLDNDKASQKEIVAAVEEQLKRLQATGEPSTFVFFFAGHGVPDAVLPLGREEKRPPRRSSGYQWLYQKVRDAGVKTVIFVFDACYAGSFQNIQGLVARSDADTEESQLEAARARMTELTRLTPGVSAFMATSAKAEAADRPYGGVYTGALLDGLTDVVEHADTNPADNIIRAGELHDYLIRRLGTGAYPPVFYGNRETPIGVRPIGITNGKAPKGLSVDSTARLGQFYYDHHDYVLAVPLLEEAARRGNPRAQASLAWLYLDGGGGMRQNEQLAVSLYRKAADKGLAEAQYTLSLLYEQGIGGLTADENLAVSWCRKAADQGYGAAQYRLAQLYEEAGGACRPTSGRRSPGFAGPLAKVRRTLRLHSAPPTTMASSA